MEDGRSRSPGPLGTLEQYLEILSEPSRGNFCIERDDIALMKSSVKEVNNLLENLLDLARTQGLSDEEDLVCDPAEALLAVQSTWTPAARLKGITLETRVERGLKVKGRTDVLQGALRNLVSNGIKFSPSGSTLHISVSKENQRVVLSVRDEGPGLEPPMLEALLSDSLSLPRKRGTANEGGSGFGLTLVKELITPLRGELTARNHPQGGAEFILHFPAL